MMSLLNANFLGISSLSFIFIYESSPRKYSRKDKHIKDTEEITLLITYLKPFYYNSYFSCTDNLILPLHRFSRNRQLYQGLLLKIENIIILLKFDSLEFNEYFQTNFRILIQGRKCDFLEY